MTIEIQRSKSIYVYRISPADARNIERRLNQHGARWGFYMVCDSPNKAKRTLLMLEKDGK